MGGEVVCNVLEFLLLDHIIYKYRQNTAAYQNKQGTIFRYFTLVLQESSEKGFYEL